MKIFNKLALVLAAGLVATGCNTENAEEYNIEQQGRTINVTVADDISRATFTDGTGFAWEQDAEEHTHFAVAYEYTSSGTVPSKKAESVSYKDGKATFTFSGLPQETTNGFFFYGVTSSGTYDNRFEVVIPQNQTQTNLGSMNKEAVVLKSAYQELGDEISVNMSVVGSILRFMPYSKSGAYSSEKIESIKLTTNQNITGTIGWNKNGEPVNLSSEVQPTEIVYFNPAQNATVSITNKAEVGVTTATSGKSIYLAIAPVSLDSYTVVITTDVATYTLTSSKGMECTSGEIVNIPVNLESDKITRKELSGAHTLNYTCGDGRWTYNLSAMGETQPTSFFNIYFDDVEISRNDATVYIEYVAGEDWLTVDWSNHYSWNLTASLNPTTAAREARVYFRYTFNETVYTSSNYSTVVQAAGTGEPVVKPVLTKNHNTDIEFSGATITNAATLTLQDNSGNPLDFATNKTNVVLTINKGANATLNDDGSVDIVFPENNYTDPIQYTLTATGTYGFNNTLQFTQAGNAGGETNTKYTYDITKNNGNVSGALWGMGVSGQNGADFSITNVQLNREYVELTEDVVGDVIEQAFKITAERPASGYDVYTPTNVEIFVKSVSIDSVNHSFTAGVGTSENSWHTICRLAWMDADETELGYWFIFVP